MGQRADSGRNAELDDKRERMEGRAQNDPARKQITDREGPPTVGGAEGGDPTERNTKTGSFRTTGDQSGSTGGAAGDDVERRLEKDDNEDRK